MQVRECPNCRGEELYATVTKAAAGDGPSMLPGLGSFLHYPDMVVVVCKGCGLIRMFAREEARAKLGGTGNWERL